MDYEIRLATKHDVSCIPEIERAAAKLFLARTSELGLTPETFDRATSIEQLQYAEREGRLWIALTPGGLVVGFALVVIIDRFAHLEEVNVLPAHGRRGIGKALIRAVCKWALGKAIPAVTLSTFREVPWNGPFYKRMGFRIVDPRDVSSGHVELVRLEKERGLRTDLRVIMRYETKNDRGHG